MKSIIFTLVAFLCAQSYQASAQRLRIGHRNANQTAVLDINMGYIEPIAIQTLTLLNYTNIKVVGLDISDNVFNPNYYASIGISVTYQEPGSPDIEKLSFLYPIVYDASMNAYYGGQPNFAGIQDGGGAKDKNPDNNFCRAKNCMGCPTLRDGNGRTLGCGICVPFNDNPWSCFVENTAGMGAERVINALGGLLKGLITIF